MNIKLTVLTAAILAGLSSAASAQNPPSATDLKDPFGASIYGAGPLAPILNTTNLSAAERSAFSLMEGVMQIAEAKIYATNCAAGTWDLEVYADGSVTPSTASTDIANAIASTILNVATVSSNGSTQFTLGASLAPSILNRGQQVTVGLKGTGNALGGTPIGVYSATNTFNNVNNMMVNSASMTIRGVNGVPDSYSGTVIKDFFRGSTDSANAEYYNIYDWGLQSVSKLNYPVNKYWQSSKVHRDDGSNGHTVWVKDRLVGAGSCRITIDTMGYNNQQPLYWQGNSMVGPGTLTIAPVAPSVVPNWF